MSDELPPFLRTIADVAGEAAALTIARRFGGTRVTVPARAEGHNWLVDAVGSEAAAAIIEEVGAARRIDIPLGPEGTYVANARQRSRRFGELEADDRTERQIARELGITERAVRYRRAKARRDARQGDLFE